MVLLVTNTSSLETLYAAFESHQLPKVQLAYYKMPVACLFLGSLLRFFFLSLWYNFLPAIASLVEASMEYFIYMDAANEMIVTVEVHIIDEMGLRFILGSSKHGFIISYCIDHTVGIDVLSILKVFGESMAA